MRAANLSEAMAEISALLETFIASDPGGCDDCVEITVGGDLLLITIERF